ncbi:MAG: hypothetical protein ACREN2_12650 [Candidatus Dormibacteria bacterium]
MRAGDPVEITAAIAAACEAADHAYWMTALVLLLAGMVPDDARPSQLLAWNFKGGTS